MCFEDRRAAVAECPELLAEVLHAPADSRIFLLSGEAPSRSVRERTHERMSQAYARTMPPQHPLVRVEHVAGELGRLAEEIGDYAGPDARTVLLHWQRELQLAVEELSRSSDARAASLSDMG